MSEEITIAKLWLTKARNDLLCADNNLNAAEIPCDMVCFHCQQTAEKCLKAFLVAHGLPYPMTHDLFLLLEKIRPIHDAERLSDALATLAPYAVEIRYPDDRSMPSLEDAVEARESAQKIVDWLHELMPELFLENNLSSY